jgi:hypothetical protein
MGGMLKYYFDETYLNDSKKFLSALDKAHYDPDVAVWLYDEEREAWKFWVSSPKFDEEIQQKQSLLPVYGKIIDLIKEAKAEEMELSDVNLVPDKNPILHDVQKYSDDMKEKAGKVKKMGPTYFGGKYFGSAIIVRANKEKENG